MHDIINFLKAAVSRAPNAGIQSCYIVRGGSIYARNTALQAGVLMDSEVDFNVPADDVEAALARIKEVEQIDFTGNTVVLKSGRLKATIYCSREEPPALSAMPTAWETTPDGLVPAATLAQNFCGDSTWTACLRLRGDRVTAMCNSCGIDITVPGMSMPQIVLTQETTAFLAAQGAPSEHCIDGSAIVFRWPDGRWMRAQLSVFQFPDIVDAVLAKAGGDTPAQITLEWGAAYADAAALSAGVVTVTPAALLGQREHSAAEVQVATAVPEGHRSHWAVKGLDPVVACAESWDPTRYPNPAPFAGPNLRGMLVGVRR